MSADHVCCGCHEAEFQPTAIIVDVLLLCVECRQPVKARITTNQWLRVEWIGPAGECLTCYRNKSPRKEIINDRAYSESSGSHT
jgi:hypothetical protein